MGKIPILTNIFQMGWNHQLVLIDDFAEMTVSLNISYHYFHIYLGEKHQPWKEVMQSLATLKFSSLVPFTESCW